MSQRVLGSDDRGNFLMRSSDPSFDNSSRSRSFDLGDGSPMRCRSPSSSDVSASCSPSASNYSNFARLLSLQLQRQMLLEQQSKANSTVLLQRTSRSNAISEDAGSITHENKLRRHSSSDMHVSPQTAASSPHCMRRHLLLMRTSSLRVTTTASDDPRERLEVLERQIAEQRQMRDGGGRPVADSRAIKRWASDHS